MTSSAFKEITELKVFKVLQEFGTLSCRKLGKIGGISKSAANRANKYLEEKRFFVPGRIPNYEKFPSLPISIISFSNVDPINVSSLVKKLKSREEVRALFHTDDHIAFILMHTSKENLFELMNEIKRDIPEYDSVTRMITPTIDKLDLRIPDKILEEVYNPK